MTIQSKDFEPDLEALADDFSAKTAADVDTALALWNATAPLLSDDLRAAWGRLCEQRLDWRGRTALRRSPQGTALMLAWATDRQIRPAAPRLPFYTPRLAYYYCASLIEQRSTPVARAALRTGRPLVVGLRIDTSTLANKGRGAYDDHIVVLNGRGGLRSARFFPACTEPGAQYSPRAALNAKGARVDARYAGVKFKKAEGADMNKDGIADLGRLVQGTYVFREKTGGFLGGRAFQSTIDQVAERDTDGDGFFTRSDPSRIDGKGAGRSMYIHRGGALETKDVNTWSAGCQTIPNDHYGEFLATLGKPGSFCYVLIDAR
jgi:hypothetical protein